MSDWASRGTLHALLALFVVPVVVSAIEGATGDHRGRLEAKIVLVGDDLSLRPVPKKPFRIQCADEGCGTTLVLSTSFDGTLGADLTPGKYVILTPDPVEFAGKRFTWSVAFEVRAGEVVKLELSNDNATVEAIETAPSLEGARPAPTESSIFQKVRQSVFKVISESGHGSGFLVDDRGLVLTNHHVVRDSDYLAVKIDEKRKYPAKLLVGDERHDVAVLRVHPDVVSSLSPLALADDKPDRAPVIVGERVLAVGSPLATETILTSGIVGKIEEGAIYSDVNINPGNSGGPLLDMLGEVIGVNTFGIQARSGPGVSGIVRIHLAKPLLEKARELLGDPPPSNTRLPEAADYRFPPDELRAMALSGEYKPAEYHVEAGKTDVQFITPVVLASLEVQAEKEAAEGRKRRTKGAGKEYKPGADFYEWRRYTGDYRPVVRVQCIPEIGLTGGSIAAVILGGLSGVAPGHVKYKFKTDFERMELSRNGVVVEPIHPGRAPELASVQVPGASIQDIAYYGAYEYPPEAFRPGAKVVLKVWEQRKEEPRVRELSEVLLQRIWADFQPYFRALETEVRGEP